MKQNFQVLEKQKKQGCLLINKNVNRKNNKKKTHLSKAQHQQEENINTQFLLKQFWSVKNTLRKYPHGKTYGTNKVLMANIVTL